MSTNIYYRVNTRGDAAHTFQILQTEDFGKRNYIVLNADGRECMSVHVQAKDTELHISNIKYSPTCAIDGGMDHGSPSVQMIKTLLKFVSLKERFEKITFYDTSTFECELQLNDASNNASNNASVRSNNMSTLSNNAFATIQISLVSHNLTIYGKTWYQRHFDATIADEDVRSQIEATVQKLQTPVSTGPMLSRIEKLLRQTVQSTESHNFKQVLMCAIDILKQSTISNKTWMDSFRDMFGNTGSVYKRFGNSFTCSLYNTLDAAINQLFELPFEYETLPMQISAGVVQGFPDIDATIDETPSHRKSWGGRSKRARRLPANNYYGRISIRNKKRHISNKKK